MAGLFSLGADTFIHMRGILKSIVVLSALNFVIGLAGCSSGASPKESASPSASPTETSETTDVKTTTIEAMNAGLAKLAQNDLEEQFLKAAINSCTKILNDGMILETVDQGQDSSSYFKPDPKSDWPTWPLSEVTVTDGVLVGRTYYNYLPALFDPCDTLISATYPLDSDSKILEHTLELLADGRYVWSQHHGGQSLDPVIFTLSDSDLITATGNGGYIASISYGPFTEEVLSSFK